MFISNSLKLLILDKITKFEGRLEKIESIMSATDDTSKPKEMYSQKIILDDEFNKIINVDVRANIAKAFSFMELNCKEGRLPHNIRKEIYERKASQSKTLINEYIDLHVKLALKADCEKDIEKGE